MKTILVPTDFSPTAQSAIRVASNLARKANGKVILLHVVDDIGDGSFNVEGEVAHTDEWQNHAFTVKMIEKARRELALLKNNLESEGVSVGTLLRLGNPFHGMQTIITEQRADIVVMGTHGSSGFEELMIGSNTEKVVRRSSCPVLSVSQIPATSHVRKIVWATSMTDDEKDFAEVVKSFQALEDAHIFLVRINTPAIFKSDVGVRQELNAFAKRYRLQNFSINSFNDYTEEEGIVRFAEDVDADLIALATHGRTGLSHVIKGSIAEDVVNHSARPVLTSVLRPEKKKKRKQ